MHYNCLVIDDEKMLADSTMEYFNLFGIKTAVSYSVLECQNFLKEHTADLLLLDINLGDGSGFELCKKLREMIDVPILFISARTSDDDKIIACETYFSGISAAYLFDGTSREGSIKTGVV